MPLLHTVSYIWLLEDPVEDSAPTDFSAFLELAVKKFDSLTPYLIPSALQITLLQIYIQIDELLLHDTPMQSCE